MTEFLRCSFCQKNQSEVRKLIAGPTDHICDECIYRCDAILSNSDATAIATRPHELVYELDRYCIGQTAAKRALAVAVYNHYKRIRMPQLSHDVEVQKGNILLLGPTGCGKTLLAQTLAKKLDVPFAIADATTLTAAGYVGEDVESVVKALFRNAGGDLEKTKRGIICIDEIDKIARRGSGPSTSRDVSGEGVQQALLKLLEGKQTNISPEQSRNRSQQDSVQVDTTNILFICSGAFTGIEEIVRRRIQHRSMGFGATLRTSQGDENQIRSMVTSQDLVEYGMIPEFMGRLPIVVTCDALSEADLVRVLTEPKNALVKQYQKLFQFEGIKLSFEPEALDSIAKIAHKRSAGARGLRSLLEESMLEVMYDLPSMDDVQECIITENVILKKGKPILVRQKKAS